MGTAKKSTVLLPATVDGLWPVQDMIEQQLDELGCEENMKTKILIAVEEIFTNIADYAYCGSPGSVEVESSAVQEEGSITICFRDSGNPYNPLTHRTDLSNQLDEKKVGGLGIHMVRSIMDEMHYRYEPPCNVLVIAKRMAFSLGEHGQKGDALEDRQ